MIDIFCYQPHSEAEERGLVGVALHLELHEGGSVALDRLGHLPFN